MANNIDKKDTSYQNEKVASNCKISTFRRIAPQVVVSVIKNLIILNKSCFDGFSSLIIPSLLGIATTLNPNETIRITASQASWLSSFTFIGHPFGSLLSGFVSDALGRRKALMFIVAPAVFAFIALSLADSFAVICGCFFFLSFIFGLKDAPSVIYVSEVSQPSIRGTLLSMTPIARNSGQFLVFLLGSILSWRHVSFTCAALPVIIVTAICFIPESPNWLLSKNRKRDAERSLQWLRGWVAADAVRDELTRLENHSASSNEATFLDKLRELRQRRTIKPFVLAICLNFLLEFSGAMVWRAYIIQVLKAYGMPWDANFITTILSSVSIAGSCCVLLSVKTVGKRRLYLGSTIVVVLCAIGLSAFGFIFFPPNWTSFENPSDATIPNFDLIRELVGNYGYLALTLLFIMKFCTSLGLDAMPPLIYAEVFSFKSRSFLCGLTLAIRYIFASIATKTYYNVEISLTLPGAVLFYGMISLIGLILMYYILPETERRSLEDIEIHYADNTKKITDIHICIKADYKNV